MRTVRERLKKREKGSEVERQGLELDAVRFATKGNGSEHFTWTHSNLEACSELFKKKANSESTFSRANLGGLEFSELSRTQF